MNEDLERDNFAVHEAGYKRFLGWLKFGTIAAAVIAVAVVLVIAR